MSASAARPASHIRVYLLAKFPEKHVDAAIEHFRNMVSEFQRGEWEPAIAKAGKFVEAVLKALYVHTGGTVAKSKDFKVDNVIRDLAQLPAGSADDSVRLTIPRACRFTYEVASNRGARHDPDEINPNRMDANAVVSLCGWILAELVRYSEKGSLDFAAAEQVVQRLSEKKYPVVEEVDGRVYFHLKGLSAREIALLTLWHAHPGRVHRKDLIAAARRHGNSEPNAKMGVSRLDRVVDDDGQGNLKLLNPGLQEAEILIAEREPKKLSSC